MEEQITGKIKFFSGTEEIAEYEVQKEQEIIDITNGDTLGDWDYFQYHVEMTQSHSNEEGRSYHQQTTIDISETKESWEEYVEVRKQMDEAMKTALDNLNKSEDEREGTEDSGPSGDTGEDSESN